MKPLRLIVVVFIGMVLALAYSCRKAAMKNPTLGTVATDSGLYVLARGAYDTGLIVPTKIPYNSSLTLFRFGSKTTVPDQFQAANGTALGLGGNDLGIYGSKMYIVLFQSNVVRIVDAHTGRMQKTDSFVNPGIGIKPPIYSNQRLPLKVYFYNGQAFVSCADGTVAVIDTSSLAITKFITVGAYGSYPCGMVAANGKFFVAMAGGGLSDTVAVFDMNTWSEVGKIQVFPYPTSVTADNEGNVYVLSSGDANFNPNQNVYPDPPTLGGIVVINSKTDQIESQTAMALASPQPIMVSGNQIYYITADNKVAVVNALTQTLTTDNFITDGTPISNASAISVNPVTGEVFVADAKPYFIQNGTVYAFDKTGKLEYSFATGVDPVKLAMLGQ
jgi:hypothetical protein